MSVSVIRSERLGLSNNLFCNKADFAAKVTSTAITVRPVGGNSKGCTEGLKVARTVIAEKGYNGFMSRSTRSKVAGMLAAWITAIQVQSGSVWAGMQAAAKKFTFVTLTLPSKQQHSDNELKRKGLGRFLQQCKREHNANSQFWRAEPQKNGNLHFHVLLDVTIPWRWVRTAWNSIMQDLGYVAEYAAKRQEYHANGFKYSKAGLTPKQKENEVKAYWYGISTGWRDPNSTDIHALYKAKNAASYVCKYISKEGEGRKVEGRIWGTTDNIRELKQPEVGVEREFIRLLHELAEVGEVQKVVYDMCTVYTGSIHEILQTYAPELVTGINLYYSDLSDYIRTYKHS